MFLLVSLHCILSWQFNKKDLTQYVRILWPADWQFSVCMCGFVTCTCMYVMCYLYHITQNYICLPVAYLQLSVCIYQHIVNTRICYLYCITSLYTQSIDCLTVTGSKVSGDPNSGKFHDWWRDLPHSPQPLWVLLLWDFLLSCGTFWTMLANVTPRIYALQWPGTEVYSSETF